MKIGILTLSLHRNYGGIIQHWALQQVVKNLGHEPVMIARQKESNRTLLIVGIRCLSFIKIILLKLVGQARNKTLYSPFDREYYPSSPKYADSKFVNGLAQTKKCYSDAELRHEIARQQFDAFIVGSDQVWRQEYSPKIENYFLDFLTADDSRKRIAYAASFGVSKNYISAEKFSFCKDLLKRFDAVSVRESNGLKILREAFQRNDAVNVLDPTLLLNADDYRKLIHRTDEVEQSPFISTYILDCDPDKQIIVEKVAEEKHLPLRKMSIIPQGGKMPTISQWLSSFANADFVITDSFHGCVFSIIFNKPFIAIGNAGRGMDRFLSLLTILGLTDRLINGSAEFYDRKNGLLTPVDYAPVIERLDQQRQHSLNFLKNALA